MLSKDQRINWDVKQCDPGEIMISASGGHESSAGGVSGVHQKMWLRMFCEMFTAELLLVASSSSDVSSGVVVTTGWAVCDQVSDTLSSWPLTTPCTLHQTHVNNNTCYHQSASQPEQCSAGHLLWEQVEWPQTWSHCWWSAPFIVSVSGQHWSAVWNLLSIPGPSVHHSTPVWCSF